MTIDDYINDFLRDGQYRIAQLSCDIDDIEDEGSYQYAEKSRQRLEIGALMDILYNGLWYIQSGYNHIQYTTTRGLDNMWTEKEVIQEIERVRYYTSMNEVPFITFTGHYPQIVAGGSGSGSAFAVPAGLPGQTIFYNASSVPYADDIDPYGGMFTGESINSYFSGRP